MDEHIISSATRDNWNRLNIDESDIENRLSKRANKRLSKKNIIPIEYFSDIKNLSVLNSILEYVEENSLSTIAVIYNLALNYLSTVGLLKFQSGFPITTNKYIEEILQPFKYFEIDSFLQGVEYPKNEKDFLGIVYQSLMKEGVKNKKGSYYTPDCIISSFKGLEAEEMFLDPCCGTGSFILAVADKIQNPRNIYGCDLDEVAVFIAKINLIVKFKDIEFSPNIYNNDFLLDNEIPQNYFDIIATNPPWGAMPKCDYSNNFSYIKSNETFSFFIANSYKYLKDHGKAFFVLPISILNVKVHADIRRFILDNFSVKEIICYGRIFDSVLSEVVSLELLKFKDGDFVHIKTPHLKTKISVDVYKNNVNNVFSLYGEQDFNILNKIYSNPYETLKNSTWGLGIVTGNNKNFINKNNSGNLEKIYSGKNLSKYFILDTDNFIDYKRNSFQQVAPDFIYKADEKLVYKFVSKKLVFAYDNQKRLFLNSANILIPKMKTHSIKTVLAFLNSKLFQYVYYVKFNELKVLKSNLLQLPFLLLPDTDKKQIESFVEDYIKLKNNDILSKIYNYIFNLFNLSEDEILYVENRLTKA